MSKFYFELRDMWQSRVRNRYRRYWDERDDDPSSVIEPICLPRWCWMLHWTRVTPAVSYGSILTIFSLRCKCMRHVWGVCDPLCHVCHVAEWCRQPDTHPQSPGAHKKHLVNSYSCSSSPAPPCLARPGQMHAMFLRNLMDLLPGLEPSEFSSSLH